jgi:hypothetical protein
VCESFSLVVVSAVFLLAGCMVFSYSQPVLAAPMSSGSSVTITAVIAPVRIILVNGRGVIIKILSNSPANVTPSVYKNKLNTKPTALTHSIYSQYSAIIQHADLHKTGVIYELKSHVDKKNIGWREWINLGSYQSGLFHMSRALFIGGLALEARFL